MISTIYLVWGAFLWRAASQPFRHRLFIDFTVAANAAHFGLMFLQGLLMPGEHIHLAGDVLLGWASPVSYTHLLQEYQERAETACPRYLAEKPAIAQGCPGTGWHAGHPSRLKRYAMHFTEKTRPVTRIAAHAGSPASST